MRLGHKNSTELHHFTIHHVNRNSLERFVFCNCRRYSPNIIHSIVYICMMFIFLQSDFEGLFFLESLAVIVNLKEHSLSQEIFMKSTERPSTFLIST